MKRLRYHSIPVPSAINPRWHYDQPVYPMWPEWHKDSECNYFTQIGAYLCVVHFYTHRPVRYQTNTTIYTSTREKTQWANRSDSSMLTYNSSKHGLSTGIHAGYLDVDQKFLKEFLDHGMANIIMMNLL